MPHTEVTRAIGLLFYRTSVRRRFFDSGEAPCPGLTPNDLAVLKSIDRTRLERVVELHRADIWRAWYVPRWPAAWMALKTELALHDDDVVGLLTGSPAFDLRVNDDATGAALAAFIDELLDQARLPGAPWLAELLDYERLLGGQWDGIDAFEFRDSPCTSARLLLLRFGHDVAAIRESLVNLRLFPDDEESSPCWVLATRDAEGVSEAVVDDETGGVLLSLLHGEAIKGELADSCRELLAELRGA